MQSVVLNKRISCLNFLRRFNFQRDDIPPIYHLFFCVAVTILVYWPVFTSQFQFSWDDQWVVLNDYTESGFNAENIGVILTSFYHGQYAPINECFYLIIYTFFGYSSFWFHTASLLIHIGNIILVYFLFKKLLSFNTQFGITSVRQISFIVTLFVAIHPFMVEAVSWIAASKCILFTFFYLLALHAYFNYIIRKNYWQYGCTILFFIISFGAKEQAITMPLCLLLFDFILKRNFKSSQLWFEKLPFFCLAICFAIITVYSQADNGEGVLSSRAHYPFYQDLLFGAYTVTEYLIKIILPIRLNYIYPFPNLPGEPIPAYLWFYPVLLLIVPLAFWKFWRKFWITFGIVFFLIQISIVSNVFPTARYAIIADRYAYLPTVGVYFLLAYLLDTALQKKSRFKYLLLCCAIVYFICLGVYSRQRCKVWHDSITLKEELRNAIKSRSDYERLKSRRNDTTVNYLNNSKL